MQRDKQEQNQGLEEILPAYSATVKVSDPEANSSKGFYTYLISGSDELGQFQIRRRYNDFFYFREALLKRWPGVFVPPIPEKKIAGNKDVENIENRKRFFDYFMKRLAKIKALFTCSVTQEFLRNKSIEMEKFYSNMPAPKTHELVGQYKKVYQRANLTEKNTHEIKANIQGFSGFLKKSEKELEALRDKVETIVDARQGFTQNLNNCTQTLLPDYEKNIYTEYLPQEQKNNPNLIFVHNMKVHANVTLLKDASAVNSFAVCLDHLNYEILQVKAMEEALKIKEKYEVELKEKQTQLSDKQMELSKLSGGKTTLKSFFSRGSKETQIQKLDLEIPEIEKEITKLQEFNNLVTIIFGQVELPIFKRNKQVQYYRMMYQISENQIKYMAAYGEFMKSVLQGLSK